MTIGLALVLLLGSYVSFGNKSANAVTSLSQDTIEFLQVQADPAVVKYYKPGDTAAFYLQDNDLKTTPSGTSTWAEIPESVLAAGFFRLSDGYTAQSTTTLTVTNAASYTKVAASYDATTPANSPLVTGGLTATVALYGVTDGTDKLVDSNSTTTGVFSLIADAAASSTVVATYTHDIVDVYAAVNDGSTVASTNNRVKVVSTSDSGGEWATISEVTSLGSAYATANLSPTSKIWAGGIELSNDPAATSPTDSKIWVQDGDTLTVTYYKSDHTTVIDSTTATIDATNPSITSVTPADGSVLKDKAPNLSFSIEDAGSGLSASTPGANVAVSVVTAAGECPILDAELSFPSRTSSKLDVQFAPVGTDKEWTDAATPTCVGRTGGGFGIDSTTLGDNTHGVGFTWKIVATDASGNSKTLSGTSLDLKIDTDTPDLTAAATGVGWDADKLIDKTQTDSIKLTFDEALDSSTVAASDFTVEGATVTEALVAGTGTTAANELVFLTLASAFGSEDRPKVELTGEVSDKAGNVLKPATGKTVADSVAKATDGIKPTLSGVVIGSTLLKKAGTASVAFEGNENLTYSSGNLSSATDSTGCSCIAVTGPTEGLASDKQGVATTVSAKKVTGTFKQTAFLTTGIYGLMIEGRDVSANQTNSGATKVSDEDLSSQITATIAASTGTAYKISKWPIADSDADGTITDEFAVTIDGTATTVTVSAIDWGENEKVTLAFSDEVTATSAVKVTYRYVTAAQVVEVDTSAPGISFVPSTGTSTDDTKPFISIVADDDEYAGDTNKTVTVNKATLKDPAGVTTDILASLSSTDNITFVYTPPAELALGLYTITASATDTAGNKKSDVAGTFTITAKTKTSISLRPGNNLVSFPNTPESTDPNDVFPAAVKSVLTYDPTVAGGWLTLVRDDAGSLVGTITAIDASKAYWVETDKFDPIKVVIPALSSGSQTLPPSYDLTVGYNLVPVTTLNKSVTAIDADLYFTGLKWTAALTFDTEAGTYTRIVPDSGTTATTTGDTLSVGKGYWVFLREAGTLVP
jgi:hypothetical protein